MDKQPIPVITLSDSEAEETIPNPPIASPYPVPNVGPDAGGELALWESDGSSSEDEEFMLGAPQEHSQVPSSPIEPLSVVLARSRARLAILKAEAETLRRTERLRQERRAEEDVDDDDVVILLEIPRNQATTTVDLDKTQEIPQSDRDSDQTG